MTVSAAGRKRDFGPRWRDDPHFDIGATSAARGSPARPARRSSSGSSPSSRRGRSTSAHPLWQIHVVERYEEGVAVGLRIHHAIGDGAALMHVLLDLTDDAPDAPLHGVEFAMSSGKTPTARHGKCSRR